ncbi:MAG: CBS domain-containing protein [Planctomycetota bacterium]|jgi:CBS domain-containing protein|nr:CBS domain-containing protein [Planctomycetota bacterium]MDP6761918.1 CBS domain-containing protein [Planctomycetota bacterium]MDP6990356.1 CBS domain-containing protein [Planctomycetota bacterium]
MTETERFLVRPCTVTITESVRDAARLMRNAHIGALVVVDGDDRPLGVVTDRDITLHVLPTGLDGAWCSVGDCMSRPAITLDRNASLCEASRLMRTSGVRRLPIVDNEGKLVGIVTADDLVGMIARQVERLAAAVFRGFENELIGESRGSVVFGRE